MRWWGCLGALAGALLLPTLGVAETHCHGPITVTANGTYPTDAPWPNSSEYGTPAAAWLHIKAPGSGTPKVNVQIFGPHTSGNTTDRAVAVLCTLDALVSYCSTDGPVEAMNAIVTGCTGTCDLRLSLCSAGSMP